MVFKMRRDVECLIIYVRMANGLLNHCIIINRQSYELLL